MSSITMKSFADSSGSNAGKKSGGFSGKLLGKMADGLEALEAIAALAANKANIFMELAMKAVKVHAQKLEARMTMPFANPDMDFNPTLNPQKAALRTPTLGLGGGGSSRPKRQDKQEE